MARVSVMRTSWFGSAPWSVSPLAVEVTPLLERRGFDEGGGGATGRVMEAGEALPQSTDAVPPRCVRCVWDRA